MEQSIPFEIFAKAKYKNSVLKKKWYSHVCISSILHISKEITGMWV